jgi:hypothetical protein
MSWRNILGTASKAILCTVGVLVAIAAIWLGLIRLVTWQVGPDGGEAWGYIIIMSTFGLTILAILLTPVLLVSFYLRFKR